MGKVNDRRSILSLSKYNDDDGASGFGKRNRSKSLREKNYDLDDDLRSSVSQQRGSGRSRGSKMPTYDEDDDRMSMMSHRSNRKSTGKIGGSSNRGRGSSIQDDAMSTYSRKSSLKSGSR